MMQDRSRSSTIDRVFDRLSRRTASRRYLPEVDGLRFIAIGLVLIFHVQVFLSVQSGESAMQVPFGAAHPLREGKDLLATVLAQGDLGVQLFFVLSGFVLALPFASFRLRGGTEPQMKPYYFRRLSRLEVPYVLALTIWYIVGSVETSGLTRHFVAGLAYLHSLALGSFNPVNGPAWSLEIEVQFYLIVPLLALVFVIRSPAFRRAAILGVILGCLVLREGMWSVGAPAEVTFLAFAEFFLLGFLLADIHITRGEPTHRSWRWDLVFFVAWPIIFTSRSTAGRLDVLILPVGCALICTAAFRGTVCSRVLSNRWIRTIGGMAYSIYLIHYPVIFLVGKSLRLGSPAWTGLDILRTAAILIPIVLALSLAFFIFIERPCMDPGWPSRVARAVRRVVVRSNSAAGKRADVVRPDSSVDEGA